MTVEEIKFRRLADAAEVIWPDLKRIEYQK